MKRRLVVEVDGDVVTVEGGGDDLTPQAKAALLMLAAKTVRADSGILQLSLFKDVKTQMVGMDFQKDELKTWGEVVAMLDGARRVAEFQEWFGMFGAAQHQAMAQMQAQMQAQSQEAAVAQSVMGNGGGRIFTRRP